MKKNEGKSAAAAIEGTSNVDKTEASIAPPATLALPSAAATEPSVERCVSAALVSHTRVIMARPPVHITHAIHFIAPYRRE